MSTAIATSLGQALRRIRQQTTGTQDRWRERTGMSQSYLSAVERGEAGWESITTITSAIEKSGADPLDLFRMVLAEEESPEVAELISLWSAADPVTRSAILTLLRGRVLPLAAER